MATLQINFRTHLTAVLALGIASQVAQIVLLRELLMVFHGNELSLGIILAAWMFWVGFGSRLGAVFAAKKTGNAALPVLISIAILGISILSVILVRNLRGFFSIETGALFSVTDMVFACILLMAPIGLLFGAQFVTLSHMWRIHDRAEDTSAAEKTYICEAFGNMIGGILFSFLMVHIFNPFQVILFSSALMLATSMFLYKRSVHEESGYRPPLGKMILVIVWGGAVILFLLANQIDQWAHKRQWTLFSPEYTLVETRQSRYGTISAVKRDDQYSFFQSGNLIFSSASPNVASPALEEHDALMFAHFALTQHPNPKEVLLIGGGLRGTIREIILHPVTRVDYIELDPVLTHFAKPRIHPSTLQALEDPRVNLIHTDGRLHVKQPGGTYDMIIIDLPDPATAVLNRYYTEEFFREARLRLNPGGVFVTGAMSAADMRSEVIANRNASIYHTMRRVFPDVLPVGDRFLFFFASNKQNRISADPSVLNARFLDRGITSEVFSSRHFYLLLEESRLRRVNWIVRNHGRSPDAHLKAPETGPLFPGSIREQDAAEADIAPLNERYFINSDFKPIGYYYTLRVWDAFSRGGQSDTFRWILHVRPWWIFPAMLSIMILSVFFKLIPPLNRAGADERFAVLSAVFSTGLSTMALQVALIFSFQSLYGFVYEMIGLIMALFMGGLALGTFASRKLIRYKGDIGTLAIIQLAIALYALGAAFALPFAGTIVSPGAVIVMIAALTFFSGMLNGADFPVSTACCHAFGGNPEKATGFVYGFELFGACAGALAASVVIAPVLGISAVCMMAAAANFTAFLALMISKTSRRKKEFR